MRLLSDIIYWLSPVGQAVKLIIGAFSWQSIKNLSWHDIRSHCRWMGLESFFLVALSAVVVAIALVIQCVIELQKYRFHDLAGGIISIGLLREIGPLTVGLAWFSRIAARVNEEAHAYIADSGEREFARNFILSRYIAALLMSVPLATYGLVIGFFTGAFIAPLLSVSSTYTFMESAQRVIEDKDLLVYFVKLVVFFPFVTIFAACACAVLKRKSVRPEAVDAVTATFISTFVANLMVTTFMYCR